MFVPLHCLNFGIGSDQTQHVLWRVQNGELDNFQPKVSQELLYLILERAQTEPVMFHKRWLIASDLLIIMHSYLFTLVCKIWQQAIAEIFSIMFVAVVDDSVLLWEKWKMLPTTLSLNYSFEFKKIVTFVFIVTVNS